MDRCCVWMEDLAMHDGDCECDCCHGANPSSEQDWLRDGYTGKARVGAVIDLHRRLTTVIAAADGWRKRQENGVALGPMLDDHIGQLIQMCTDLEGLCCLGSDCATTPTLV